MKKRIITSLLFLGVIPIIVLGGSSCTFEDILDHSSEKHKELDKSQNNEKEYDFVITPENITGNFREFLQSIVEYHSNILIKNGTYEIELTNGDGVRPKDSCTITFEPNAKIKVRPNRLEVYSVFDTRNRKNITFNNPFLIGDKDEHLGTTGEWCYGIRIVECENIVVRNANISKFWGDGLVIREAKNIKIYSPTLEHNRRQGISITSCENVDIYNPTISYTSGTSPAFGIDIEPNFNGEHVKNLRIHNAIFKYNASGKNEYPAGFCLSTHMIGKALPKGKKEYISTYFDIELINPTFYGDALIVSTPTDLVHGKLVVKNPVFYDTRETSLNFFNHQSSNFKTEIISPVMHNSVQKEKSSIYYTPILFWCFSARTTKTTGTQNIKITNPKIIANNTAKYRASIINNITNSSFSNDMKNVTIENIIQEGYETTLMNHSGSDKKNIKQRLSTFSNLDETFVLSIDPKSSKLPNIKSGTEVSKTLSNALADFRDYSSNPIIYLTEDIPISGFELYYVNNSANKAPLSLNFGSKSALTKKTIERKNHPKHFSNKIIIPYGSYVTLSKKGANTWKIIDEKSSDNISY
ncbi:right-handed parallel beta-helix repeat-containing protein [Capnocytophaga cynodegmi]|uniref:right-handed parallel beta-helix repeat-containing protein n=1 Tax=Capnocytophaga cynodegmi TaxID=28189 RepID=UPI001ACC6DA0|nr:right-handed parallel beta-helix repeat-containing protein [Capnocytophaga cynodegmi]GIM54978.1 hypothetical protein CAPN005_16250 [Capnocytophaga cynodegmi]